MIAKLHSAISKRANGKPPLRAVKAGAWLKICTLLQAHRFARLVLLERRNSKALSLTGAFSQRESSKFAFLEGSLPGDIGRIGIMPNI
jgi:hypothetical protein